MRAEAPWLVDVPAGWASVPLRHLADVETGSADTQDADPDGEYPFVVRSPRLLAIDHFTHDCEAILTPGDGDVGRVFHHLNGKFAAHQRVYVLSNFRGITGRFAYYAFSSTFRHVTDSGTAKSTVESLRRPMLTSFPLPVPPADTQGVIVDFLDRETAKIDALIAKQERLVALLDEREDALRKAWTLGHTQGGAATRIGRVLERLERPPAEPAPIVTAYRDGQVTGRGVRREDGYTLSFTEHGYQGVEVGDVVFHGLDGFAGAVGVAEVSGKCSPVYHVCRAREGHDAEYLAQHIRALGVSGMLEKFAWSVRQRSADYRNWALFAALPIAVPSLHEQREAADEIRRADERASRLRSSAKACIDLLRERRAALITAAVTGRLDVTTYGKAG